MTPKTEPSQTDAEEFASQPIVSIAEEAKDHVFNQLLTRWHMQHLAAQCAPDLALAHAAMQMLVDMNDGEPDWLSYLDETLLDLSNQKRSDNHTKLLGAKLRKTFAPKLEASTTQPSESKQLPIELPPQSTNSVGCKGQPLAPILWQGRQWAVTEFGIEARNGCYSIGAGDHFWGSHGQWAKGLGIGVDECWLMHIRRKIWVDIDDFTNAVAAFKVLFDREGNRNSYEQQPKAP